MPICAVLLFALTAGCDEESSPADASTTPHIDGSCEPSIPPGTDAGGLVSPDYPTCCFSLGVGAPTLRAITASRSTDASGPDADVVDGGVAAAAMAVGEAFPVPTSARWLATTLTDGGAALELDVDGEMWTVSVEESAPIPSPPEGGIDVELIADATTFALARQSDATLLVAWIRQYQREVVRLDETRTVGAIELALGAACYGWQDSGFGCGGGFLAYGLDASSGSASAFVPPRMAGTLEIAGARYTIENRVVSQAGGSSGPGCSDFRQPVFDADVIIDAL